MYRLNDHEAALDIVQEVFEKFWKYRDNYDASRPLENYIVSIAKNLIIDHYKRNSEKQFEQREENDRKIHPISPEDTFIYNEQKNLVLSAIRKFPLKTKEIFFLSRIKGFKNKEIAEMLSVSEKSVEYHITKVLKEMKPLIINS